MDYNRICLPNRQTSAKNKKKGLGRGGTTMDVMTGMDGERI